VSDEPSPLAAPPGRAELLGRLSHTRLAVRIELTAQSIAKG